MKGAGLLVLACPAARCGAGFLVLLLATPVLAQEAPGPDPVRLDYTRATGAEACPEESFLRTAVAARLGGRDVFTDGGERRITLALRRPGRGGYEADAALYDATGRRLGSRELKESNCTRLVEAMGTVFVSWLLPILPPAPPVVAAPIAAEPLPPAPAAPIVAELSPPAPAEPPRSAGTDAAPPTPAPPVPSPRPLVVLDVGPLVAFATEPGVAFGLAGGVGVRWPMFSLALEVRGDLPTSTAPQLRGGGQARVSVIAGTLVPCLHLGKLVGCALVTGGALAVSRGANVWNQHPVAYAGGGARLGVELPIVDQRLAVRLAGDVLVPFVHPIVTMEGATTWTTPPVGAALGARLVASF